MYRFNPLSDDRWEHFLNRHPRSSIFHTKGWLRALSLTCGYEPVVVTSSAEASELDDGIVLCRVNSLLTGARLVSVPFADHCDPLNASEPLYSYIASIPQRERLRYVELRSTEALTGGAPSNLTPSVLTYNLHVVDLTPDLGVIFSRFHQSSTQRKIRRAEREHLTELSGGPELIDMFYRLMLLTRRRHRVPPHPKCWFLNLAACLGSALCIRIALASDRPVAAILTLRHRETLYFKYGCSDSRYNALGGTHLLFWKAMQEAKSGGLTRFDLGRSDNDDTGLITFKNRWGAHASTLRYVRLGLGPVPFSNLGSSEKPQWQKRIQNLICSLPDPIFQAAGSILFRHLG